MLRGNIRAVDTEQGQAVHAAQAGYRRNIPQQLLRSQLRCQPVVSHLGGNRSPSAYHKNIFHTHLRKSVRFYTFYYIKRAGHMQ